jgi:hypothetical protein
MPIGYSTNYTDIREENKNKQYYKIFYFLAKYVGGHVHDNIKYQWLNAQELQQILPKSAYMKLSHIFQISQ